MLCKGEKSLAADLLFAARSGVGFKSFVAVR